MKLGCRPGVAPGFDELHPAVRRKSKLPVFSFADKWMLESLCQGSRVARCRATPVRVRGKFLDQENLYPGFGSRSFRGCFFSRGCSGGSQTGGI